MNFISMPCNYEGETLVVKALNLRAEGYPAEQAYFTAIKSAPELYAELCTGVITEDKGKYTLIVPYSQKVYDRILEVEPFPLDKPKKKREGVLKATSDEVLKYGYE